MKETLVPYFISLFPLAFIGIGLFWVISAIVTGKIYRWTGLPFRDKQIFSGFTFKQSQIAFFTSSQYCVCWGVLKQIFRQENHLFLERIQGNYNPFGRRISLFLRLFNSSGGDLVISYNGEFGEILFYITFGCIDRRNQDDA